MELLLTEMGKTVGGACLESVWVARGGNQQF